MICGKSHRNLTKGNIKRGSFIGSGGAIGVILRRLFAAAALIVVAAAAAACAPTNHREHMRALIHGVICDPAQATLIARDNTNDGRPGRYELYRTAGGHYFVESRIDGDIALNLVSDDEASRLYSDMTQHRGHYAMVLSN